MGFGALNQHVEKQRHKGFAGHLSKWKTEEKTNLMFVWKKHKQKRNQHRKSQEFFLKKSDKPSHNVDLLQDTVAEPGQTVATGQ